MNNLTKTLLGSVAIAAVAVPAMAARPHPAFNVTALHAGKTVNKTNMHNQKAGHITYSLYVYTYIFSLQHAWVPLTASFYKWNSYSTLCSNPKQHVKFPKKTEHGQLRAATETYSHGCPSGPTVYHGVDYKSLETAQQDEADISHIGTFRNSRGKYKGTLNLKIFFFVE